MMTDSSGKVQPSTLLSGKEGNDPPDTGQSEQTDTGQSEKTDTEQCEKTETGQGGRKGSDSPYQGSGLVDETEQNNKAIGPQEKFMPRGGSPSTKPSHVFKRHLSGTQNINEGLFIRGKIAEFKQQKDLADQHNGNTKTVLRNPPKGEATNRIDHCSGATSVNGASGKKDFDKNSPVYDHVQYITGRGKSSERSNGNRSERERKNVEYPTNRESFNEIHTEEVDDLVIVNFQSKEDDQGKRFNNDLNVDFGPGVTLEYEVDECKPDEKNEESDVTGLEVKEDVGFIWNDAHSINEKNIDADENLTEKHVGKDSRLFEEINNETELGRDRITNSFTGRPVPAPRRLKLEKEKLGQKQDSRPASPESDSSSCGPASEEYVSDTFDEYTSIDPPVQSLIDETKYDHKTLHVRAKGPMANANELDKSHTEKTQLSQTVSEGNAQKADIQYELKTFDGNYLVSDGSGWSQLNIPYDVADVKIDEDLISLDKNVFQIVRNEENKIVLRSVNNIPVPFNSPVKLGFKTSGTENRKMKRQKQQSATHEKENQKEEGLQEHNVECPQKPASDSSCDTISTYSADASDPEELVSKNRPLLSINVKIFDNESKKCKTMAAVCQSLEEYLKWMYVMNNKDASTKISGKALKIEHGEIILMVDSLSEADLKEKVENVLKSSHANMNDLIVAYLQGTESSIFDNIEKSTLAAENKLYILKAPEEHKLHFVCSNNHISQVEKEFKDAFEKLKIDFNWHFCLEFTSAKEYTMVFDHFRDQKKIPRAVQFEYKVGSRKKACHCSLRGQNLSEIVKSMQDMIENFTINSFGFSDIKNLNSIRSLSVEMYLQGELYDICGVSSDDYVFKVDNNEERVTVGGTQQDVVDRITAKVKSCIKRKTIYASRLYTLPWSRVVDFQSANKNKIVMKMIDEKCECAGNENVLNRLEDHLNQMEKDKKESKDFKKSNTKVVGIKDYNTFEFIKRFVGIDAIPQDTSVSVEAKDNFDDFGFVLKGSIDDEIETCEHFIKAIENKVKKKEIRLSVQRNKFTEYYTMTQEVERDFAVRVSGAGKMCWTFSSAHSLMLCCEGTEHCLKDLYVDVKVGRTDDFSPQTVQNGKFTRITMTIPEYQEPVGKELHYFSAVMKATLEEAFKIDPIHICIPMDKKYGWPIRKFARPIIFEVADFLQKATNKLPTVVELCLKDVDEFAICARKISDALPGKGSDEMKVTIVGFAERIDKAESRLKTIAHQVYIQDKTVVQGTETANTEIESEDGGKKLEAEEAARKHEILVRRHSLVGYVHISNIPKDYKFIELKKHLVSLRLPIKRLIFLEQMLEAVLICDSSTDTLRFGDETNLKFRCLERQPLGKFEMVISDKLNEVMMQNAMLAFEKQLRQLDVTIDKKNGFTVTAETLYQIKCVRVVLQRCIRESQQKGKMRIIKDVAERVWEILKEEKKQKVEDFEKLNGSITHKNDILTLIGNEFKGNDDSFDDYANVFESFVKELNDFEFQDIPIDDEHLDKTTEWISELTGTSKRQCSFFIPMQKKVIALFDSYETWKRIELFFLVKQGKRKQTGRRRGGATGSGPASIQPSDATLPEEKRTQLDLGKDAKGRETYKTAEGMQVYVYEANILKLDVQCIVNAANDTLNHGGGVAAVIARAAGYKLTEEGNLFIRRNRKLPVGSVVTTSAGHLQYKAVIHAVGPCWSDYGRSAEEVCRCEDDLFSAIYESCVEAEKNKFKSVAFPAISSAIFGVPEDLCVCEYVKATLAFSKTWPRSLTEIHFIDKNPAIIGRIQREFKTVLEDCQESPYQRSVYVRTGKRHGRRYQTNQGVDTTKYNKTSHSPVPSIQKEVLPTGHNEKDVCGNASVSNMYRFDRDKETKLYVNKGDLLRLEPCVAVVVTLNEDGRGGALASGVAAEMQVNSRDRYKRDIKKRLTGKLKVGQIALTDGYASRFSHIIHVVLPLSERKQQPHIRRLHLCDVYRNIFTEVSKERDVNAIATTLIGIGHTTDEIDLGCGAFLDGYLSYLNEQLPEGCSHPNVYLVCAEQNVFDRVCETFNSHYEKVTNTEQCHDSSSRSKEHLEVGTKEDQDCVICMDKVTIPMKLACGHIFCTDCIDKYFEVKKACPTCGTVCGIITGDQPSGNINMNYSSRRCSGYPECGQISIIYTFPSGRQQENHPNPGSWYDGITRTAYLPDNEEGKKILKMLQIAFERKLVFTIGRSRTTGKEGVITWNDIHHKTDPRPNTQFGYPDATYLQRVKEELAAKGVTEDDIKKPSHYV